jgi:hypothetical protein
LKFLPLDRIADKDLKNALWEALQTAADETIVTPGAGDVPRVLRGNIGSALLQYKSFITAFHTNVFIPILRQKESRGFLGQAIASSLTLGIVTEDLKERFAGRKPDYKSLDYWKQALWRSGVLSVFPDMIDAAEWMVKREDISTVSPTVQRVNDILKVGSTVLKKKRKISEQKMRKMVGLIPFGNLFYLKTFLGDPAIRWESKRSGRKLAKNYNFLGLE